MPVAAPDSVGEARRGNEHVAVLGSATAARLGITNLQGQPAVFVGSTPFVVIGILSDVRRRPGLLTSVIIPRAAAQDLWAPPADESAKMLITTQLGAAAQTASEVPLVLPPTTPTTCAPPHRPTPASCGPEWRTTPDSSSCSSRPSAW